MRYRLSLKFYLSNGTELTNCRRDVFIDVDGSKSDALTYADQIVPTLFPYKVEFSYASVHLQTGDPRSNVKWAVNNKGQVITDDD